MSWHMTCHFFFPFWRNNYNNDSRFISQSDEENEGSYNFGLLLGFVSPWSRLCDSGITIVFFHRQIISWNVLYNLKEENKGLRGCLGTSPSLIQLKVFWVLAQSFSQYSTISTVKYIVKRGGDPILDNFSNYNKVINVQHILDFW